jgi:uncharacterized membrane protein
MRYFRDRAREKETSYFLSMFFHILVIVAILIIAAIVYFLILHNGFNHVTLILEIDRRLEDF